ARMPSPVSRFVRFPKGRSLGRLGAGGIGGGGTARRQGTKGRSKKKPGASAGRCSLLMPRGDQRPAMTLSRPNRWASDLSSRRWSSLKLITSGNPADLSPSIFTLLKSIEAVRLAPCVDFLLYSILRSSASTAGQ